MQTLLKLTVTGTGEKIEEVEGEVVGRERAQSMWTERPKLAALQGDTMKGKILQREDSKKLLQEMAKLPDKVEATEPEIPQPVLPAAAELSRDGTSLPVLLLFIVCFNVICRARNFGSLQKN